MNPFSREQQPFLHLVPLDNVLGYEFEERLGDIIGPKFLKVWKEEKGDLLWTNINDILNRVLDIKDCEVNDFSDGVLTADFAAFDVVRIRRARRFAEPKHAEYFDPVYWKDMGFTVKR